MSTAFRCTCTHMYRYIASYSIFCAKFAKADYVGEIPTWRNM